MKTVNSLLLAAIKARTQTQSEFNSGILTADRYVKTLTTCVGNELCERHGSTKDHSFSDMLKSAESTLTYNNPDMVVTDVYSDLKETFGTEHGIEVPKNTLMIFKHVLTTPRKDRDGDVLRTEGAKVDPKMLLLWQHVHTLPIGKMLKVLEHNSKTLTMLTAIVDINELSHDSAVMIENKMGRFSHGFRALSFCDLKEEPGSTTGYNGFDVKEFEVMEESLVSVPANPDAEQQEILLDLIEGDKLSSSMMKSFGRRLRSMQKTTTVAGGFVEKKSEKSNETGTGCGCKGGGSGVQNAASGSSKEADAASTPKSSEEDESSEGLMCPTCKVELEDGECPKCGYIKAKNTHPTSKSTSGVKSFYGPLPNSWEDTQEALRKNLRSFLITNGSMIENKDDGPYSYSWILGTDASKCVACVESSGKTTYYQINWEKDLSGLAQFIGSPKEVMIRVSAEVLEKSKKASGLQVGEKTGKVLSTANIEVIKGIEADLVEIHEHCSTRSGKALCVKATGSIKALITQAEAAKPPEGEIKPTPGGEGLLSMQAAASFLAKSTPEDRTLVFGILKAQCSIDETTKLTQEILKSLKEA